MMASKNDSDAVMGLRSAQGLFQSEGISLVEALLFAAASLPALQAARRATIDHQPFSPAVRAAPLVNITGMPECRMPRLGHIEIVLSGKTTGEVVSLPGASAAEAEAVALNMKDALIAAVINKSRFKLKVVDIRNNRGDIAETVLQAEYDRPGMTPIRVWSNVKGEVAALAAVLRRMVASCLPELLAA
jgi:hypothetical protein